MEENVMNGFENISNEEMLEVDGGFWFTTTAVVIGVATGVAYAVGAYKAYKR